MAEKSSVNDVAVMPPDADVDDGATLDTGAALTEELAAGALGAALDDGDAAELDAADDGGADELDADELPELPQPAIVRPAANSAAAIVAFFP